MSFKYKETEFHVLFTCDHIVGNRIEEHKAILVRLFNGNEVEIYFNESKEDRKIFRFTEEDCHVIEIKNSEIPFILFPIFKEKYYRSMKPDDYKGKIITILQYPKCFKLINEDKLMIDSKSFFQRVTTKKSITLFKRFYLFNRK